MNNNIKSVSRTSIFAPEFEDYLTYDHRLLFSVLGFRTVGDFLRLRVFDFLNINQTDSGVAEEVILDLCRFIRTTEEDEDAFENYFIDDQMRTARWLKAHGSAEHITVADLVFDSNMTEHAFKNIYNGIANAFYKSAEYDQHEYKYARLCEVPKKDSVRNEKK